VKDRAACGSTRSDQWERRSPRRSFLSAPAHATDEAKRRTVDRLVKPAPQTDVSEPTDRKLKAVENHVVAAGLEIGNVLAAGTETARSASP